MRGHAKRTIGASGAALAVVAILSVSALDGSDRTSAQSRPQDSPELQKFAVFRGAGAGTPDAHEASRLVTATRDGDIDPETIRLALRNDETLVHVAGGPRLVCLATRNSGGGGSLGCTDAESATNVDRPMMSVDSLGGRAWQVTGLVPDGVSNVRITAAGRSQAVSVTNNVFSAAVATTPQNVTYETPGGVTRTVTFGHLAD